MRSRSAPGSSTRTSRLTRSPVRILVALIVLPIAAAYVIAAFVAPSPLIRIGLRSLPVLPVAVWTLWFDRSRPLQQMPSAIRAGGRLALLVIVMAFAVALLGIGLNWLYDPDRVI
jgi:hypothetical protein